jgi:hypothetical protein
VADIPVDAFDQFARRPQLVETHVQSQDMGCQFNQTP